MLPGGRGVTRGRPASWDPDPDEGVQVTPATQITESTAERLREVRRLSCERMSGTPVEGALGMVIEELTEDSLVLAAPVPLRDGRPDPLGVLALRCVLIDTAAGLAAGGGLAFGNGGATVEFRMDHAAPLDPDAHRLRAEGRLLHVVGSAALAAAVLRDDRGQVLVRAQGYFARKFDGPAAAETPVPRDQSGRLGELCDALVLEPAADPAERLVQLPEIVANSRGHIHGGMAIALSELVQCDVRAADAAESRLLSMHVEYLRPAICDGTPVACRTRYVRRGRRFATLRTEIVRPDGRIAEIATGLWATED
jgi:uncharacterized protein (TIGR00369 family)